MSYYNNNSYSSSDLSRRKLRLMLIGGIPNIEKWEYLDILYDDDNVILNRLEMHTFRADKITETYKIDRKKIIAMDLITNQTIKEKEKSVIGRGLVGGLVFGPAGLILGGMSGIGTTTTVKATTYFVIAYIGKDESDIKNLVFTTEMFAPICQLFIAEYNSSGKKKEEKLEPNENGEYIL